MDFDNDFRGSFADENVRFTTQVIKLSHYGDSYWKTMVFVENDRFVTVNDEWVSVPGSNEAVKAIAVSADTYVNHTTELLQSWLYDLFINANINDCILVAFGPKDSATEADLEAAYELMKMYAYHKTVCAGGDNVNDTEALKYELKLAKLCKADNEFISSIPYFPMITATPDTDPLYQAISKEGTADAFMVYHADTTRNGALYLLGLALADMNNGSGTPVGNSLNMQKSGNITSSGPDGSVPTPGQKTILDNAKVGYFKPVGDNSGNVACENGYSIKGDMVSATWVKGYITYMVKVGIAILITQRNFKKNESIYGKFIQILSNYISKFGSAGVLEDTAITAPMYQNLPPASKSLITIPNAWVATYSDGVHEVRITGTMYIGA